MGELNLNFQIILDLIGLVQGVVLGVLLLILNKRNYRSSFFLGFFLLCFSLELAGWISVSPQVSERFPQLFLMPFVFSWLLFPLFFLYTQQVSLLNYGKPTYWILYPGIVSFVLQSGIFWLPYETKQVIVQSEWYVLCFWVFGLFYSWFIGIWNLRLLYRHQVEVQNTYSFIEFKELRWARIFLIYLLTTSILAQILKYGPSSKVDFKIIFSVMDLIAIYWISYLGIMQRNVRALINIDLPEVNSPPNQSVAQKIPTEMALEGLEGLMKQIDAYMISSESYINPDLTVVNLAEALKVHPKRISTAINMLSKQNFNVYVNGFRIEKAKRLLTTEKTENLSIEGIGNEVGFKSKSAFYTAFKKLTGATPTQYKEMVEV